jgi:WD40 repeat protein
MRTLIVLLIPFAVQAQDAPSFAKDVLPIFQANCAGCHSSMAKMGSLDLDSYEAAMKGGNHGTIIAPGKSEESRLYLMIAGKMAPAMPMSGKSLAAGDIETIRRWIDAGARPPAPGEVSATPKTTAPVLKPQAPPKPEIDAVAYSPDGSMLATGGYREVRLLDRKGNLTGALKGHAEKVRALAFSRDGKLLAGAGGEPGRFGEVKIWDVAKRQELRTIKGHTDCIYAVAFSPDGASLATSSYDKLIILWDSATGRELRTLKDHIDAVYALAYTPDGKRLVSAAADRTVKVWDPATGERLYTMGEPLDGLNTVAVHPEGRIVAAGGLDKTIRIWSLGEKSGTLTNSLIAHEDAILDLTFSPDGELLVSTAADRTIKIFKAADLTELKAIKQPDWAMALDVTPDGKTFAAGRFDGTLAQEALR